MPLFHVIHVPYLHFLIFDQVQQRLSLPVRKSIKQEALTMESKVYISSQLMEKVMWLLCVSKFELFVIRKCSLKLLKALLCTAVQTVLSQGLSKILSSHLETKWELRVFWVLGFVLFVQHDIIKPLKLSYKTAWRSYCKFLLLFLAKSGPIYSVDWNPNSVEFCVVYGCIVKELNFNLLEKVREQVSITVQLKTKNLPRWLFVTINMFWTV